MQPASATAPTGFLGAYDAVAAALREALVPIGVQVVDGPIGAKEMDPDVVLIGVGDDGITVTRSRAGFAGRRDETLDLRLVVSSWSGDDDLAARRVRIREILDVIAGLCDQRPAVADVVDSLEFDDDIVMAQQHQPDGAVVEVALNLLARLLR